MITAQDIKSAKMFQLRAMLQNEQLMEDERKAIQVEICYRQVYGDK
jgi:hypothetical protein